MRPGAILVSIVSLLLSLSAVVWLSNSMGNVNVETSSMKPPAIADLPDTPRPADDAGLQPKADFAETKFDFGIMKLHQKGSHTFKVTNSGEAPLKLKAGESTCQCTVGEVGTQEVAPGESTTIELSWEVRNPNEMFEHSAVIHTNAPEHKDGEVRLIVHGRILADAGVVPPERINLGTVEGTEKNGTFFFYSRYHESFKLLSIDSPNENVLVKFSPLDADGLAEVASQLGVGAPPEALSQGGSEALPPKSGYRVEVTVLPTISVGNVDTVLTLHTDIEAAPEFTYTVSVYRRTPFQFFPMPGTRFIPRTGVVSTGEFEAARGTKMELLMLAAGQAEPLKVSVLKSEPEWMKVSVTEDNSNQGVPRQRLTIEIPAGIPPVVRTADNPATIRLKTNHPDAETLDLSVTFLSN